MENMDKERIRCHECNDSQFESCGDGFYYCLTCGTRIEDMVETGVSDEDFLRGGLYYPYFKRPKSSCNHHQNNLPLFDVIETGDSHGDKPSVHIIGSTSYKCLSYEDYYSEVRMRYVTGMQVMIQMQCEALVNKFGVSPLICGISGSIWLRFVAASRVFDDSWADDAISEYEAKKRKAGKEKDFTLGIKNEGEPHNFHSERAIKIWLKSLQEKIPLSCSPVISFLACHIAREAIMSTDIEKWLHEGKLPYLNAFIEIETCIGQPSKACPLSSASMFRPIRVVRSQYFESSAASIAHTIGLHLPPVNFYGIALRYLKSLSLPVDKILPQACSVFEWLMPPDLWLSVNELRLPTHIGVMSILIVTIRILYDINGFGNWEDSLSNNSSSCSTSVQTQEYNSKSRKFKMRSNVPKAEKDVGGLLKHLEAMYHKIDHAHEYTKDLQSYLEYCNDIVFAELDLSSLDYEEQKLMKEFWDFYINQKEADPLKEKQMSNGSEGSSGQETPEVLKEKAIRQMKSDMEENMFCYMTPRQKPKTSAYLQYVRKREERYTYAAHADYYILLRVCARLAQVDMRNMHVGVLSLENRLVWLEERIKHILCDTHTQG